MPPSSNILCHLFRAMANSWLDPHFCWHYIRGNHKAGAVILSWIDIYRSQVRIVFLFTVHNTLSWGYCIITHQIHLSMYFGQTAQWLNRKLTPPDRYSEAITSFQIPAPDESKQVRVPEPFSRWANPSCISVISQEWWKQRKHAPPCCITSPAIFSDSMR